MTKKIRILLFVVIVLSSSQLFSYGKIYDCFLFFNELEVLQIRLDELYESVDYFVIVESVETFRGNPKPLIFSNNQHLFKKYADKIIHVALHERQETQNPWDREHYQRAQISRGLTDCKDDDIIMISDADEFINHNCLEQLIYTLENDPTHRIYCGLTMYRYFLNRWDAPCTPWVGTCLIAYGKLKHTNADHVRSEKGNLTTFAYINDCGWHFTSMGGLERFITKIESFSHAESDVPLNKDPVKMRRESSKQFLVEIDSRLPSYIQNNVAYLKEIGFIDPLSDIPRNQLKEVWRSYDRLSSEQKASSFPEPFLSASDLLFDSSGWVEPYAFNILEQFIDENHVKTVIDIGAWLGLSTHCLAFMLPDDGKVYAVDLWSSEKECERDCRAPFAYDYFLSNMKHMGVANKVIPVRMSSLEASQLLEIEADLIYLDTSRDAYEMYQDIMAWYPRLSPGGMICGILGEKEVCRETLQSVASELNLSYSEHHNFWYLNRAS